MRKRKDWCYLKAQKSQDQTSSIAMDILKPGMEEIIAQAKPFIPNKVQCVVCYEGPDGELYSLSVYRDFLRKPTFAVGMTSKGFSSLEQVKVFFESKGYPFCQETVYDYRLGGDFGAKVFVGLKSISSDKENQRIVNDAMKKIKKASAKAAAAEKASA